MLEGINCFQLHYAKFLTGLSISAYYRLILFTYITSYSSVSYEELIAAKQCLWFSLNSCVQLVALTIVCSILQKLFL